ncbi:uncharacterized protein LOC130990991 [Salvia miltiorrhiza]|uniref:uncharacterized protein LOC130990991 n=1 Tax=Salvia miltiorrhiza TaxID=226208 RepID=UPI0025AD436D|nr:uncharacterized protein LOC130990991 [Salvia miltiorrhiza]
MLLEVLKKALPDNESLPSSYYEAKTIIQGLGWNYEKVHACVNDCVLFRKKYENEEECPNCSAPRYKFNDLAKDATNGKQRKKIPQKILRYFPLKSRLQKLFLFKETAKDMRWHLEQRTDDGVLRHPADAQEWKDFDKKYESFGQEPRNVRLGLASDGFNPFSNMNLSHSTWPVILLPYNLPPWKCLKAPFFILSMLIPGPKSPGNDIDVFQEPLIDELKELWDHGIETYDASTDSLFNLHAAVLWTINDFPAYGNLSGWSTKGYLACPVCNKETCSTWLQNGKKVCYMGHRRFLPRGHKWRSNRAAFDGKSELRDKPIPLTGDDVVQQLSNVNPVKFGKVQLHQKKRKRDVDLNWTKHSTLLNISGKTKDTINARLDLQEMGIRPQLHPKLRGNSYLVPSACYTLTILEKRRLCSFLASVKYPDAYASNLSKRVNATSCHITGLKTHDCHIILQQLLPISIHGLLDNNVHEAIHEISNFFRQLSSRTLKRMDLDLLENQIAFTLCKLERIFPPQFFDIMMHLPVHLVRETILGGPVQYRWMYPIERYLYRLKQYVTNKAHPEGSMAEGYIAEECMTQFNKAERNYEKSKDLAQHNLLVFSENIASASTEESHRFHENLMYLSYGPDERVTHYDGCIVNGLRFHTKRHDLNKRTQNYGVVVKVGDDDSGLQEYYGVLVDIVQVDYLGNHSVTLFYCDWFEGKAVQKDKYNYTSVNMSKPWKTNEPYVLATQAEQVYYVNDIKLGNDWKVVIPAQARSLWNVVENKDNECITSNESYQQNESQSTVDLIQHHDDSIQWYDASNTQEDNVHESEDDFDTD